MSSSAPVSKFSRLSLQRMPPTTRSQRQRESSSGHESDQQSDGSDASVDDDDYHEAPRIVRSPTTDIIYDISGLDRETQKGVRQLFLPEPGQEQPQFVLQGCRSHVEDDGHFYAFEMLETVRVRRSIRVGSPRSQRRCKPKCLCMGDSERPCRHLIFLLDQVNYHTAGHDSGGPEHLGPDGYPAEMGHPFERISGFHLDQLAASLNCNIIPDSTPDVNPAQLQQVREILASVEEPNLDDHACDRFRPDIFDNPQAISEDDALIFYEDLTHTVANMLMRNKGFFAYFLGLLEPSSKARDPFRKIQQRVDRVLADLGAFSRDPSRASITKNATEGDPDVPWAAAHIERAVSTIQALLQNRSDGPSSSSERASAARTLVRILHVIVLYWNRNVTHSAATAASTSSSAPKSSATTQTATTPTLNDSNLYHRLIGGQTHGSSAFLLDVLAQLPEQNQWIETLEEIEDHLSAYAPPALYIGRLRDLILRMRSIRPAPVSEVHTSGPSRRGGGSTAGNKRSRGGGNGREGGAKRMK